MSAGATLTFTVFEVTHLEQLSFGKTSLPGSILFHDVCLKYRKTLPDLSTSGEKEPPNIEREVTCISREEDIRIGTSSPRKRWVTTWTYRGPNLPDSEHWLVADTSIKSKTVSQSELAPLLQTLTWMHKAIVDEKTLLQCAAAYGDVVGGLERSSSPRTLRSSALKLALEQANLEQLKNRINVNTWLEDEVGKSIPALELLWTSGFGNMINQHLARHKELSQKADDLKTKIGNRLAGLMPIIEALTASDAALMSELKTFESSIVGGIGLFLAASQASTSLGIGGWWTFGFAICFGLIGISVPLYIALRSAARHKREVL